MRKRCIFLCTQVAVSECGHRRASLLFMCRWNVPLWERKAGGSGQDGKQRTGIVSLWALSKFDENLTHAEVQLSLLYGGNGPSIWPIVRFPPWFLFQLVPPLSVSARTAPGKAFHSSFTVLSHAPEICLCARTQTLRRPFIYSIHWPGVEV